MVSPKKKKSSSQKVRKVAKKAVKVKKKALKKPTVKKLVKVSAPPKPMGKLVGKVVHFYPNILVAVVEVASKIKEGDKLNFAKNEFSFQQKVTSMQIDYKRVQEAKKGQVVGMKVTQPVKEGTLVYLI